MPRACPCVPRGSPCAVTALGRVDGASTITVP
jgi:hypothetical protein